MFNGCNPVKNMEMNCFEKIKKMISSPAPKEYWVKREGNICWTKNGFLL